MEAMRHSPAASATIIFWFLVVLTVLVFVHELGHYLVARWNDVRVEVFSIGFGPELFGWNDRAGTRWKISAIPLGRLREDVRRCRSGLDAGRRPARDDGGRARGRFPSQAPAAARGDCRGRDPIANFIFAIVALTGSVHRPSASLSRRRRSARCRQAAPPKPPACKAGDTIVSHRRPARSSASRTCSASCGSIPASRSRLSCIAAIRMSACR